MEPQCLKKILSAWMNKNQSQKAHVENNSAANTNLEMRSCDNVVSRLNRRTKPSGGV